MKNLTSTITSTLTLVLMWAIFAIPILAITVISLLTSNIDNHEG